MYGYRCEYCEGTVNERVVKKEVFRNKDSFVILEDVPISICDNCGYTYYHSTILSRVDKIAENKGEPKRTKPIPNVRYTSEHAP